MGVTELGHCYWLEYESDIEPCTHVYAHVGCK